MSTSFGLRNQRGSCWVNATLQALFRIPDVQTRYSSEAALDSSPVDVCLQEIWSSKGEEGLKSFYECVKTAVMPAGEGIGDSHELLEFLCDKLPFLDKLCRFKVGNTIKCSHCTYKDTRIDSMIEFSVSPTQSKQSLTDCVIQSVTPVTIPDWTCEQCKQKGCTKQLLLSTFPQVLVFHATSLNTTTSYSSLLVLNQQKYALFSVVCFNGGHWWTYGRDMPPGKDWVEYDDFSVHTRGPQNFPLSDHMRLLFYYRLKE
jgi:ubiquitin C-terminal hydrolase